MSTPDNQQNYIETILIKKLVETRPNSKILDYSLIKSTGIDGFMSALYLLDLKLENITSNEITNVQLIIKFMKGNKLFRTASKSYTQFANEIHIYLNVLPYYDQISLKSLHWVNNSKENPNGLPDNSIGDNKPTKNSEASSINVKDWVPYVYVAEYGCINGLGDSSSSESVLVMENLKPFGYRNGPPQFLDLNHINLMSDIIAKYHSFSYILKIRKDPKLNELINNIIHLPFKPEKNDNSNLYEILYRIAFDRFYKYIDTIKNKNTNNSNADNDDCKFFNELQRLKEKYFANPVELLDKLHCDSVNNPNDIFPVILHGDYNRNNVLFQYDETAGFNNPKNCKMIDFQELRYGSPALDLSFYMYFNMDSSVRNAHWMDILKRYHKTLLNTMQTVLKIDEDHDDLKPFSFDEFYKHFSKYAFYGVLICMHYYPWMAGTDKDTEKISYLFETDMFGKEFYEFSMEIGGVKGDSGILDIVKHAYKMGYTKNL